MWTYHKFQIKKSSDIFLSVLFKYKASAVSKGTQSSVQQKTCFGVDLIDQFVRTASVVFTLPVLPSMQSSMTFLCLETSLPMQRSHWHLMLRHFYPKLVSGNNTATAISMHCIVRSLKPERALRRGYTPPKRWSRLVKITCGLHHMWLKKCLDLLWGNPCREQLISSVRSPGCNIWIWQCQPSEHWSVMAGPEFLSGSTWSPED